VHPTPASAGLDQAGLEALFRRLEGPVYNVVYRWVWDHQDASEVVQEAFVRLWRMRARVRMDTVEPLLYRIALNQASKKLRWRKTWRWLSFERGGDERSLDDPGADRVLDHQQRQRAVRAAVEALPEKQRAVVMLCELSGLSYAEVAQTLGIPEGTVASRRHTALESLRRSLGRDYQEELS
jgi:RNA polymerase sigma-70 factor (ECF subfamily)